MYVIWWLTYYKPLSILPPPPLSSSWSVYSSFFLLPGSSLFLDLPRSFFFLEDIRGSAEGCDHRGTGRDDYDVGGAGGQRPRTRQGQRHDDLRSQETKRRRDSRETDADRRRQSCPIPVLSLPYHCRFFVSFPYLPHPLMSHFPSQVFALISSGEAQRHIGATDFNEKSSRSHTIFRMVIESPLAPPSLARVRAPLPPSKRSTRRF